MITIIDVVSLKYGSFDKPVKRWRVTTYSYPQYYPYLGKRSKGARNQRTIRHQYDIVFEIDQSLSINSKDWKYRIGSDRIPIKPDQSQVKQVYHETRERWENDAKRKFKTAKEQKKYVSDLIEKHKKYAPYLDVGDWISQVLQINQDFYWRLRGLYYVYGHLYSKALVKDVPSSNTIPFMDKHFIRFFQELLNRGILNNDPVEDKNKK